MNKWIMAGTAAAFTGAAAFARSEYELTHLDIVHYDIKTDKLGLEWNGFKAVFLSDLHDNSFGMENEELLAAIEKEQPDIVVIGGDMLVVCLQICIKNLLSDILCITHLAIMSSA